MPPFAIHFTRMSLKRTDIWEKIFVLAGNLNHIISVGLCNVNHIKHHTYISLVFYTNGRFHIEVYKTLVLSTCFKIAKSVEIIVNIIYHLPKDTRTGSRPSIIQKDYLYLCLVMSVYIMT